MANANGPHGFIPVRTKNGSGCIAASRYTVAAGNGAIGIGDVVIWDTTGTITGRSAATPAAGTVVGVAAEAKAASSGGTMLVYDDPNIVYEGQSTTALTQAAVGANMDITDAVPVSGISQQVLSGTPATTISLVFKVMRLYPVVGNTFGTNNRIEVIFNKLANQAAGDGETAI